MNVTWEPGVAQAMQRHGGSNHSVPRSVLRRSSPVSRRRTIIRRWNTNAACRRSCHRQTTDLAVNATDICCSSARAAKCVNRPLRYLSGCGGRIPGIDGISSTFIFMPLALTISPASDPLCTDPAISPRSSCWSAVPPRRPASAGRLRGVDVTLTV